MGDWLFGVKCRAETNPAQQGMSEQKQNDRALPGTEDQRVGTSEIAYIVLASFIQGAVWFWFLPPDLHERLAVPSSPGLQAFALTALIAVFVGVFLAARFASPKLRLFVVGGTYYIIWTASMVAGWILDGTPGIRLALRATLYGSFAAFLCCAVLQFIESRRSRRSR